MKQKGLNVVSVLTGLLFMNGGLNKFFNYMPVPPDLPQQLVKDNEALVEIIWLLPLVGAAETLGGLLLLFPKTRALGILVVFPVMVGVLLTHIFVDATGLPIALTIWAILIWLIAENLQRFRQLVG